MQAGRELVLAVVLIVTCLSAGDVVAGPEKVDLEGRVIDAGGKPVAEARVLANVKSWPGGRFTMRPFAGRTGTDGVFRLAGCVPEGARHELNVAAFKDGFAFASEYRSVAEGEAPPPLALRLAKAHQVTLLCVDADDRPLRGVQVTPAKRVTPDGAEHVVYAQGAGALAKTSRADGQVVLRCFAKGDTATLRVRFPGRESEERTITVTGDPEETIRIPREQAAAGDLDLRAGGDENKRFFLLGPGPGVTPPEAGFGLLLVLPGGDGSAEFRPFVRNIHQRAVPSDVLVAQLVSVKWTDGQRIVWPTKKNKVKRMKFTTEAFIAAVVKEVGERHRIDPRRVFTLSWSSSGPACYAASLAPKTPVKGSFVAMSVFSKSWLPSLSAARGHAYYIYHSPDDATCPYRMAQDARDRLSAKGAKVTLVTYSGGHGWHGDAFGGIRKGLRWLEESVKR
jgi:predicted esterase